MANTAHSCSTLLDQRRGNQSLSPPAHLKSSTTLPEAALIRRPRTETSRPHPSNHRHHRKPWSQPRPLPLLLAVLYPRDLPPPLRHFLPPEAWRAGRGTGPEESCTCPWLPWYILWTLAEVSQCCYQEALRPLSFRVTGLFCPRILLFSRGPLEGRRHKPAQTTFATMSGIGARSSLAPAHRYYLSLCSRDGSGIGRREFVHFIFASSAVVPAIAPTGQSRQKQWVYGALVCAHSPSSSSSCSSVLLALPCCGGVLCLLLFAALCSWWGGPGVLTLDSGGVVPLSPWCGVGVGAL